MADTKGTIRKFIVTEMMFEDDESILKFDDNLLETGILDSAGIVQLVLYLEKEFSVSIPPENLLPENFETIESITMMLSAAGVV